MWQQLAISAGVGAVGALAAIVGMGLSRRKGWWLAGFFAPLVVLLMIVGARRINGLEFLAPFKWLMAGRVEFVLLAPVTMMMLTSVAAKLKKARERKLVVMFGAAFVIHSAMSPFFMPAVVRGRLMRLGTAMDRDGVCLQQTRYTCGPAAAATVLRKLGIQVEEGELGVLMHTSPTGGTAPDVMAAELERAYSAQGLRCEYRQCSTLDELPPDAMALAVIKLGLMVDHFVAVLDVKADRVVVGDPLEGRVEWTREEFESRWRKAVVVVRRENGD